MADAELVAMLIGVLVAVVGIASFPAIRLPVTWLASTLLVRLAVVVPQALPFVRWQSWCLAAAIAGFLGTLVTLVWMYRWVLQGNVLTLPPGTPPLFHVFLPGIFLSDLSTGSLSVPLWIFPLLVLNGILVCVLAFVWMRVMQRRAQQVRQNSGTGSAW